jgi:hypothetical protein
VSRKKQHQLYSDYITPASFGDRKMEIISWLVSTTEVFLGKEDWCVFREGCLRTSKADEKNSRIICREKFYIQLLMS